jgi:hypothetical protein
MPQIVSLLAGVANGTVGQLVASCNGTDEKLILTDVVTLYDVAPVHGSTPTPAYLSDAGITSQPLCIQLNAERDGNIYVLGKGRLPSHTLTESPSYDDSTPIVTALPLSDKAIDGDNIKAEICRGSVNGKLAIALSWSITVQHECLLGMCGTLFPVLDSSLYLVFSLEGADEVCTIILNTDPNKNNSYSRQEYQGKGLYYSVSPSASSLDTLKRELPWVSSVACATLSPANYTNGYLFLAVRNTNEEAATLEVLTPNGWKATWTVLPEVPMTSEDCMRQTFESETPATLDHMWVMVVKLQPPQETSQDDVLKILNQRTYGSVAYTVPGAATGNNVVAVAVSGRCDPVTGDVKIDFETEDGAIHDATLAQLLSGNSLTFSNEMSKESISKTFTDDAMACLVLSMSEVRQMLQATTAQQQIELSPMRFEPSSLTYGRAIEFINKIPLTPASYHIQDPPRPLPKTSEAKIGAVKSLAPTVSSLSRTFTLFLQDIPKTNTLGSPIFWNTVCLTPTSQAALDPTVVLNEPSFDQTRQSLSFMVNISHNLESARGSSLVWEIRGTANGLNMWGCQQVEEWTVTLSPWTLRPEYYYSVLDLSLEASHEKTQTLLSVTPLPLFQASAHYTWYVKYSSTNLQTGAMLEMSSSGTFLPSLDRFNDKDAFACLVSIIPQDKVATDEGIEDVSFWTSSHTLLDLSKKPNGNTAVPFVIPTIPKPRPGYLHASPSVLAHQFHG